MIKVTGKLYCLNYTHFTVFQFQLRGSYTKAYDAGVQKHYLNKELAL